MKNPTQQLRITSPAFLQALLHSERLRIRIVIAAILAAFAIRTARTAILFSHENLNLWVVTTAFIAIVLICEVLVLRAVNRAISEGHDLPNAAWIANIVIETCLPALALAFLSGGVPDARYSPLACSLPAAGLQVPKNLRNRAARGRSSVAAHAE